MKRVLIFVVLVSMCSFVFAVSGVSPVSYDVDFEPGYKGEFVFDFNIEGESADLFVEGDLAEYVSLDKNKISGREKVVAVLDFPLELKIPGVNYIKIGAGSVGGFIKVNVPYPERYVEVGLNAPDVNVGEDVFFDVELFGRGIESVVVTPRIELFFEGEVVEVFDLDDVDVAPDEEVNVNFSLDTENYSAGDYLAVAFASYDDKNVSVENPFRIGEFSVDLINYTKSLRENKVNRFEIFVENLWNGDMSEVYAEVSVLGFDSVGFATSSEDLSAWESQVLSGFLDVAGIEGDSLEAEIVLYYGDESVSEIVELEIVEGFDYIFWIVILVVVVGTLFVFWRGSVFARKFKKYVRKKG